MTNPAQTLVRMIGFLIIVGIIAGFLYAPLVDAFLANPALNGMILAALLIYPVGTKEWPKRYVLSHVPLSRFCQDGASLAM